MPATLCQKILAVFLPFSFLFLLNLPVFGQFFSFSAFHQVEVMMDGEPLSHPWTGSYNSGQFWPCDMNNDGIDDMLVYDKTANRVVVYLAQIQGAEMVWRFAPDYADLIPSVRSWIATADFNCDGRMDLFTQTSLGIRVYRNIEVAPNQTGFTLEIDGLTSQGFSGIINVQVNPYGSPAIVDVDGDGDLDVLAFDFSGNTVEYHQNRVMQISGTCSGFNLKKDTCVFGRFATLPTCGTIKTNTGCYGQLPPVNPGPSVERTAHIGSQLAAIDLDGDGDKDLLVGDIGCPLLNRLTNGGTPANAFITTADTLFPSPAQYIKIPVFPSAYSMDINFDSRPDLVITPTSFSNIGDGNVINTRAATYLYHDISQTQVPQYQLIEKDFLQNQTIDLGEESIPALADVDADGDLDMVVGHRGLKNGELLESSLFFYRNIGSAFHPRFQLESTNYLNIASLIRKRIRPIFMDLNGDGALDFAWISSPGTASDSTRLHFLLNQNPAGQPFSFPAISNAGMLNFVFAGYDCPVFFDVDGDGKKDMLIGKNNGRIQYWRQTGNWPNPQFELVNNNYGNILRAPFSGNANLAIADVDADGHADLCVGDGGGAIKWYRNFLLNPTNQFSMDSVWHFNVLMDQKTVRYWGPFVSPALGDLNGDGYPEMLLGVEGGGVELFVNRLGPNRVASKIEPKVWQIFPNPAQPGAALKLPGPIPDGVEIFQVSGKKVAELNVNELENRHFSLPALQDGIYFLRVRKGASAEVLKLVVSQ